MTNLWDQVAIHFSQAEQVKPKKRSLKTLLKNLKRYTTSNFAANVTLYWDSSGHIDTDPQGGFETNFTSIKELKQLLENLGGELEKEIPVADPASIICQDCGQVMENPTQLEIDHEAHATWEGCLVALDQRKSEILHIRGRGKGISEAPGETDNTITQAVEKLNSTLQTMQKMKEAFQEIDQLRKNT